MKTTIQWLKEYLETKVLPCSEDNEYVYGMNVAHNNLIHYMIPYLLEKEKEQIIDAFEYGQINVNEDGCLSEENGAQEYYNQTYNLNK